MDFLSYYVGICTISVIFLLYYAYKLEKANEKLKKEKDELNVQRAKDISMMWEQYNAYLNKKTNEDLLRTTLREMRNPFEAKRR